MAFNDAQAWHAEPHVAEGCVKAIIGIPFRMYFAQEGVVLVTCNRRLGAEGFLYLEELFGENVGPGNLGMQDLICVLEWLADNIQAFGGDPNNITLFGESGGAAAAQATIATPGASGLINRAILQSGGHAVQRHTTATRIARHVIDQLGIKMRDVEALRVWHAMLWLRAKTV